MIFDPIVDVVSGTVIERSLVNTGTIVVGIRPQEAVFNGKGRVILKPDGVCQTHFICLALRKLIHVGQHEAVQVFSVHAQHLLHLCQRLAVGTIGSHGQGIQDGQRRNQGVLSIFRCGLEQPHAEICRSTCACIHVRQDFHRFGRDILHQVDRIVLAAGSQMKGHYYYKDHSNDSFHNCPPLSEIKWADLLLQSCSL